MDASTALFSWWEASPWAMSQRRMGRHEENVFLNFETAWFAARPVPAYGAKWFWPPDFHGGPHRAETRAG